tara:strand:- start:107 stop:247 length:141 start_codon:yes stop_codon:yes gene_type:complete
MRGKLMKRRLRYLLLFFNYSLGTSTKKETRYEAGFFLNAIVATLVC